MIPHRDITLHRACRVCDAPLNDIYLDLGEQPLANAFLAPTELEQPEFTAPLQVALCARCGLSQLTVVVAPERLYSNYIFLSSTSEPWKGHCDALAAAYTREYGERKFVLEIGSNDGALLSIFKRYGHKVLGIEPAQNITERVSVPTLALFWSADVARQVASQYGKADLVIATNVLGHVDNVRDFVLGIAHALAPSGVACIECPHIGPLLTLHAFDTIYHEHLSYWSLRPLERLAEECGLFVFAAEPQKVHGGTMRYWLCPQKAAHFTDSLTSLWKHELRSCYREPTPYHEFGAAVAAARPALVEAFASPGLHGWGASAKGNTLLNYVGASLPVIYDDTPLKQGLRTPGRHIPVAALPTSLREVEALALLAWNWADELKVKAKMRDFRGRFLTPIPTPTWSE